MSTTPRSQSATAEHGRSQITLYYPKDNKVIKQQIANLSFGLNEIIQIRELDKRYTHANPRRGRCNMEKCNNLATHWITRNNANYCQSDMACNQHALIWIQVKDLISDSSSLNSK
ncbi:MAG: hypothetical protein RLZZ04_262 [Cyanobacteriota bacterium]|jgi:hypothetical protein